MAYVLKGDITPQRIEHLSLLGLSPRITEQEYNELDLLLKTYYQAEDIYILRGEFESYSLKRETTKERYDELVPGVQAAYRKKLSRTDTEWLEHMLPPLLGPAAPKDGLKELLRPFVGSLDELELIAGVIYKLGVEEHKWK